MKEITERKFERIKKKEDERQNEENGQILNEIVKEYGEQNEEKRQKSKKIVKQAKNHIPNFS